MVKVVFVLVSVKDSEGQHAACDGLGLLQQLVEMHHGIICKRAMTEMSLRIEGQDKPTGAQRFTLSATREGRQAFDSFL